MGSKATWQETIPFPRKNTRRVFALSGAEAFELENLIQAYIMLSSLKVEKNVVVSDVLVVRDFLEGALILLMKKKDESMRLWVTNRQLNKVTINNKYPLPKLDDLMDQLMGAPVFSKIDLRSGYHQIHVKSSKTAFMTSCSQYKYMTKEEHAEHLRVILQILKDKQLYAKMSKFGWLGHVIFQGGIVDPSKIEVMIEWEMTKDVDLIEQFRDLSLIMKRVGKVFYQVALPLIIANLHNVFHDSQLRKYVFDPSPCD
ncbi:hypothetical protein CR513_30172, partial [Mucuna pruriens]